MSNLSVLDLLSGLDDKLIAAATLPASAVPLPRRRLRFSRLGDWLNDGRVAVVASVLVAVGVLCGIVAAGRMALNGHTPGVSPSAPPGETIVEEKTDETSDETVAEEDNEEPSTESPRVTVESRANALPLTDGYLVWAEIWVGDGMLSADGSGAERELLRIRDELKTLTVSEGEDVSATLHNSEENLRSVVVCDQNGQRMATGADMSILSELDAGEYYVVLSVQKQGAYIPEADAHEGSCYEYAFILVSLRADVG